ncbi:hypothetical protein I8751_09940 [Nostocaceae cyanobacterium CENA357]|uniref:Uncharacterized protein n=1 Tax=Atlanticothrix silvestris CENA357 TaxID=1725252 RepID=A0A8J7L265_9CYAN|nr:hypothetical protein [Atlanticothrix silvestris]MBH8552686.1 hypothetical protein [Atlanticothrix silvestris CENA357]
MYLAEYLVSGGNCKLPESDATDAVLDFKDDLKAITHNSGKQLLNGKHLQCKLITKEANLLFNE